MILKNLVDVTKPCGIDQILAKFLKDGAPGKAIRLINKINLSIKFDTFPWKRKIVKKKPSFKKRIKTEVKNCRAFSLLPLISKVMEKSIHDQVQDYLQRNEFLHIYQSGVSQNKLFHRYMFVAVNRDDFKQLLKQEIYLYVFNRSLKLFWHLRSKDFIRRNKVHWSDKEMVSLHQQPFYVLLDNVFSEGGTINIGVSKGPILGPSCFCYIKMIFNKPCQILINTCIRTTLAFGD